MTLRPRAVSIGQICTALPVIAVLAVPLSGCGVFAKTGFEVDPGPSQPFNMAVDAADNLWVSNLDMPYNSHTQFVGLSAPTRTPRLGLPVASYPCPQRPPAAS